MLQSYHVQGLCLLRSLTNSKNINLHSLKQNKKKIFNDPLYGFISIPHPLVFDLIEHPWFQRLRRIRQLGLTHMVYPGALHTRFHHALGALHLSCQAIETIRSKDHPISPEEALGLQIAMLLHDIGHGPFSHALEHTLVEGISHESLSVLFMEGLNVEFNGGLKTAIEIFRNTYPKKFLHQLVSGQLDMDRLDYLNRDSFYTGVLEGKIGAQRIIKMLDVENDQLVVEEKGVYSIEKFIVARRLMYWQVYLHKTVLAAEQLLVKILKRAIELSSAGEKLFATPVLSEFLSGAFKAADFKNSDILHRYALLDDYDLYASIKTWMTHPDFILSRLCTSLINRKLYKVVIRKENFTEAEIGEFLKKAQKKFGLNADDAAYLVFAGSVSNSAYDPLNDEIRVMFRNGKGMELSSATEHLNLVMLSEPVQRHFICIDPELKD